MSYYPQKWYNPIMNILEYENYQEKIPHGNPLFPYITYPCSIPLDFSRVPLHWHDEMEIIYIKKGTKAPQAAGKIHTDFERGFIKAEVVNYQDLLDNGSLAAAREKGIVGMEGKDYVVKDGDVILFRFNV